MKSVIVLFVLIVVGVGVMRAGDNDSGGGSTSANASTANDRPGDASVYQKIDSSIDCQELQGTFDRAADNNDLYAAGSFLFKVTLSYMHEANERMESIGCYG